jgi:hypothetical protein
MRTSNLTTFVISTGLRKNSFIDTRYRLFGRTFCFHLQGWSKQLAGSVAVSLSPDPCCLSINPCVDSWPYNETESDSETLAFFPPWYPPLWRRGIEPIEKWRQARIFSWLVYNCTHNERNLLAAVPSDYGTVQKWQKILTITTSLYNIVMKFEIHHGDPNTAATFQLLLRR